MKRLFFNNDGDGECKKIKLEGVLKPHSSVLSTSSLIQLNVGGELIFVPSDYFTKSSEAVNSTILSNRLSDTKEYYVECFNTKLFKMIIRWLSTETLNCLDLSSSEKRELLTLCKQFNLPVLENQVKESMKYIKCEYSIDHLANTNTPLIGMNLSNFEIINFSLQGRDVKLSNFNNVNIISCINSSNFTKCELSNTTFSENNISNVHFDQSIMNNTRFADNTMFKECSFQNINLKSTNLLNNCYFMGTKFQNSEFPAELTNCTFEQCDFTNASLRDTIITRCKFIDTNLHNLLNSSFETIVFKDNCQFKGVNFQSCNLKNFNFENQHNQFENCNFSNCKFTNKINGPFEFKDCNFENSIFDGCITGDSSILFEKCNFRGSQLLACYLKQSKLINCKFTSSRLQCKIDVKECKISSCDFSSANIEVELPNFNSPTSSITTPFQFFLLYNSSKVELNNAELIFRGSIDGFTASQFHNKCDEKGATICLVKSNLQNNKILGGITTSSWARSEFTKSVKDSNSYFFTFQNDILLFKEVEYIRHQSNFLCCFGDSLTIVNNCDKFACSSFKNPSEEANNFKVEEIEVFSFSNK